MVANDFKIYKKTVETPVTVKEYSLLFAGYCKFMMNKVLEGFVINLPLRFGILHIKGVKPRVTKDGTIHKPVNWKATIEMWNKFPEKKKAGTTVKWLNSHTDGYTYSFRWGKAGAFLKNKSVYHFKVSRANKRALKDRIMSGQEFLNRER